MSEGTTTIEDDLPFFNDPCLEDVKMRAKVTIELIQDARLANRPYDDITRIKSVGFERILELLTE